MADLAVSSSVRRAASAPWTSSLATHRAGTPGVEGAADHAGGQRGFGEELDVVRYSGLRASFGVGGPGHREVELAVEHRVSTHPGVGEVDRDLGVWSGRAPRSKQYLRAQRLRLRRQPQLGDHLETGVDQHPGQLLGAV